MDYTKLFLCLSFSSQTICIQFAQHEKFQKFCSVFLNQSTFYLIESFTSITVNDNLKAQEIFQEQLQRVSVIIEQVILLNYKKKKNIFVLVKNFILYIFTFIKI